MKATYLFVVVAILGFFAPGVNALPDPAPPQNDLHSMKGWELYSWKSRNSWVFRLTVGTNRMKSEAEIFNPKEPPDDIAGLKKKLSALKKGEEVFWIGPTSGGFQLPPTAVVEDIVAFARSRGLVVHIQSSIR